jgi:hypothetical protein
MRLQMKILINGMRRMMLGISLERIITEHKALINRILKEHQIPALTAIMPQIISTISLKTIPHLRIMPPHKMRIAPKMKVWRTIKL